MYRLLYHHHHITSQIAKTLTNCKKITKHCYYNQKTHGFVFPETLEVSKKGTNNQCAIQQYLRKGDTLYSGIKKVIKLTNKVVS